MKVSGLFKAGLTVPEHETRDLHYIGEALPVPSLITSSISVEADVSTGNSPIPAREDHVHAVDVDSLIQFINDHEEDIDLTNYYTKDEVNALIDDVIAGDADLTNYYTKSEVDAFIDAIVATFDDYYTKTEIDALITATFDAIVLWFEKDWSYGPISNPAADVYLNRYVAFQDITLTELDLSFTVGATATDQDVELWVDNGSGFYLYDTFTIAATDIYQQNVFGSPLTLIAGDQMYPAVVTNASGDGEKLTISARGFYTP